MGPALPEPGSLGGGGVTRWFAGYAAGFVLSLAVVVILETAGIHIGFIGGVLLGFSLSQLGGLLGLAASR